MTRVVSLRLLNFVALCQSLLSLEVGAPDARWPLRLGLPELLFPLPLDAERCAPLAAPGG